MAGPAETSATPFPVELPGAETSPLSKIRGRVLIALGLVTLVALTAYIGRDGYVDPDDGSISVLDAFYYSTVSITTTGYGDIRPASEGARLVNTVVVTPARILFLILLVGTTLEILAERSRQAYRVARWRRKLKEHTIVCGYGVKGRSAVRTLIGKGTDPGEIVAIEQRAEARALATADGVAAVAGSAANQEALIEAGVREAAAIVVATDRDDTAVLVALTARELNAEATIVASVREEENVHLLHQSGADAVITSSGAAGRLLGLSTQTPQVTGRRRPRHHRALDRAAGRRAGAGPADRGDRARDRPRRRGDPLRRPARRRAAGGRSRARAAQQPRLSKLAGQPV